MQIFVDAFYKMVKSIPWSQELFPLFPSLFSPFIMMSAIYDKCYRYVVKEWER